MRKRYNLLYVALMKFHVLNQDGKIILTPMVDADHLRQRLQIKGILLKKQNNTKTQLKRFWA